MQQNQRRNVQDWLNLFDATNKRASLRLFSSLAAGEQSKLLYPRHDIRLQRAKSKLIQMKPEVTKVASYPDFYPELAPYQIERQSKV